MKANSENIEYLDLITKKLSEEISPEEDRKLQQWMEMSQENQQVFDSYQATWDEMDRVKGKTSRELDQEWQRLENAIDLDDDTATQRSLFGMIMRVAAGVLVFAMAAFSIYYLLGEQEDIQLTTQADIQQAELSEGSQVTINSNSTLTYPKKFVGNKREVELSGEAYFEVAEDPERPFIIHAGAIQVEVLGTSFNVKAYEHLNEIEVTVSSGKVAVYRSDKPGERVVLVKGQMAHFYKEEAKIEKKLNENINFASWKTKQIIFEDTPMPDVIRIINEIYKSDLRLLGDELNSCPVSTTFEDQSLESILKVLESTLNLTIDRKDQYIEISGEGC